MAEQLNKKEEIQTEEEILLPEEFFDPKETEEQPLFIEEAEEVLSEEPIDVLQEDAFEG